MNPARSAATTGDLSSRRASSETSATTSGSVTTVLITSTNSCTGAGLKKCIPTTRRGRSVATEISVTDNDEVLVARMASSRTILSSAEKISRFRSRCSTTASTTRSQSASASSSVANVTRSNSACWSASDSLPRFTARSVECWMCPRPRSTASPSRSTPTTVSPLRANTSAIPAPIVPRPTTPTVFSSRAMGRSVPAVHWSAHEVGHPLSAARTRPDTSARRSRRTAHPPRTARCHPTS